MSLMLSPLPVGGRYGRLGQTLASVSLLQREVAWTCGCGLRDPQSESTQSSCTLLSVALEARGCPQRVPPTDTELGRQRGGGGGERSS